MTTAPAPEGVLPLTPLQEGLLFHALYDDEGPDVYTTQLALDLAGPLDRPRLRAAAQALLDRHPNLRAGFRSRGLPRPLQVLAASAGLPWAEVDLTGLPAAEQDAELERLTAQQRADRFDLAAPPLLRFAVVTRSGDRHRLLVTNHHILLDGWSTSVLLGELFGLYAGAELPAAPVYRHFLAWLQRQDRTAAVAAWQQALAGVGEPTLVAPAGSGLAARTPERASARLSTAQVERLTGMARDRDVTVATALQGLWAVLVGRLTGRDDVVVGTTVSGRPAELPGVERMVGLFLSTLPVRARLTPTRSLGGYLADLQQEQWRLQPHQHLGLAEVQRAAGRTELFDTLVVVENFPLDPAAALPGGLRVTGSAGTDATHYPLVLLAVPDAEGTELRLTYRDDLFDRAAAERMLDAYLGLVELACADPDRPLGRLAVLDPVPLAAVGVGAVPAGRVAGLPELFAARVAAHPDRVAVDGATTLTYAELDARAAALAGALRAAGLPPESPVALRLERGPDVLVAVLAVARAGLSYLPLDERWPADRVRLVLADAGARLLLVDDPSRAGPGADGLAVLPVTATGDPLAAGPVHPDRGAYVMFTSGSTGEPKGVVVTHRAVAELAADSAFATGHERVLMHAPLAFDASTYEIWVPLLAGGTVVVAPPGPLDAATLRDAVAGHGVTGGFFTAGLFRLLAEESPDAFAGMTTVWAGGEAVPAAAVRRVRQHCPGVEVVDGYGPTETTTFALTWALPAGAAVPDPMPIGRPLDGTWTLVLDPALRPVPVGVAGELYVAGAGLARGYLGRPGLTAERFVASPYGPAGTRMYRTGDVVSWSTRPGHPLNYLGRVDDQVKLRGFRIEPAEVESVVAAVAGGTVAVVVREDSPGDRRLVAYLVGATAELAAVRTEVARRLPEYMVPAAFVPLETLPLTGNGKLDRRALPAPDRAAAAGGRAPRTPTEELLCGLVAQVLGLPAVSVDDGFFALGGHSLLATRLVGRIRSTFDLELPVRAVFDHPTVAGLAALLAGPGAGPPRPALHPRPRPERLPLSYAQRRLWFLNRLEPGAGTYTIPFAIRLRGAVDPEVVRAALQDVTARHEVLRTVFRDEGGEPWQQILDPAAVRPALLTAEVTEDGLAAAMTAAGGCGFDLAREIPLRAHLFTLAAGEHVLLLLVHHVAGDGWSAGPLARDFATAYASRRDGAAPAGAPLPVQYGDYALWQRELLGDERDADSPAASQLAYWTRQLAGLPDQLVLPTDRPRPAVASHRGDTVALSLDAELHAALRRLADNAGASLFMVLQAAVAGWLGHLGAGTDVPLGTPVAGRTDEALDDLVGFFVNTLVLRTDLSGDPTFRDLLSRARATGLAAHAHQDLPFERLVDVLEPERSLSRNPLFQVLLALQNTPRAEVALPGLDVEPLTLSLPVAKFDLELSFTERLTEDGTPAGLEALVGYATDLFDRSTVERLLSYLDRLLRAVAADPRTPLSRVEVLAPAERAALLAGAAGPGTAAAPMSMAALVERSTVATPDAPAVVADAETLTYRELDARAGRLARRLAGRGIGRGDLVALRMPRSVDLAVAVVAVSKAGAAWLPVDPTYPPERVELLLADSRPALVLDSASLDGPEADPRPADPRDLAYVIYTSGSTGTPKGVAVTSAGLATLARLHADRLGVGPDSRVLQFASPSFDASVWELAMAWGNGAALVLTPADRLLLGEQLTEHLRRHRVSHATLPPVALATLPADGLPAGLTLVTAGEACTPELVERFASDRLMVNGYGPTETTVCATQSGPLAADGSTPPIGAAIPGLRAYVLDAALRPVPVGVAGELYVGGAALARGYLGRPGTTAERFVADPYGPAGERLYRTGDLVRRRTDGQLVFLDRADQQVKLRGFRVELGEVAAAVAARPGVARAVAVVREDTPGEKRLVAYAVPAGEVDPAAVRAALTASLPAYLVPAAVVLLDAIPVTPNGKLDRRALPAPVFDTGAGEGRAPATPAEETFCRLTAELLGLPSVAADQSFFDLGGDSIGSIQLVGRARAAGLSITPQDVFARRTPAGLAEVARPVVEAEEDEDAGIGPVPLTPIVRWLAELGGPVDRFNQSVLLQVPAGLDEDRLRGAVQAVLDRHDALRLRLTRGPEWSLEVRPRGAVDAATVVRRIDGLDRVAEEARAAVDRLAPEAGMVVQVVWFDAGDRPGRLLVTAHHLAVDGVSWRILVPDLAQAAGGAPLARVGTPLRVWAERLVELAGTPGRAGHWVNALTAPDPLLSVRPLDRSVDTMGTSRSLTLTLPPADTAPLLTTVPATVTATVQDVLLSGLALAVGDWQRRRYLADAGGVLVDVEGHGREEALVPGADLSRTVGWFTSMAPVRLDAGALAARSAWTDEAALRRLVGRVKDQLRSAGDRGLGWGLARYVDPAGAALAALPEPQLGFNYLGRVAAAEGPAGDWAVAADADVLRELATDPAMPSPHALDLNAVTVDGSAGPTLTATWTWPAALFAEADVADLAETWFRALRALAGAGADAAGVALTPSDLSLVELDQDEIDLLETTWEPSR